MKKALFLLPLLFVMMMLPSRAAEPEMRAMWVSSVYNLDYPSRPGLSADALKKEADALLDMAEGCGLNTIILQVRPTADSLYASSCFPWSSYLTGAQGQGIAGGFDPLAYFVQQGHARGIAIHAWCNPYRITKTSAATREAALAQLCDWHPARKNPELVVYHTDGNLYFNPGEPKAAELILKGIFEIVENYDIDAIHLDDYFYPSSNFDDAATFSKYGESDQTMGDFRRANVTRFVKALHEGIQARKPAVELGISPFGIWANASKNPQGSNTVGGQSYYDHYADSRTWVKEELVDYISPQLYWPTGNREGEFAELLRWWGTVVEGTDVKLYPGLGAYRLTDAAADSPWAGTREMESQITQIEQSKNASGMIFFRAGSISDNAALKAMLTRRFTQNELAVQPFKVTRPSSGLSTSSSRYYFAGSSDRTQPLTVNGTEITSRSENGYWGTLQPLSFGDNTFTFQNGTKTTTITIRRTPSTRSEFSSLFPQKDTLVQQGQKVSLSCLAPSGGTVYANVGSRKVPMTRGSDGVWRGSFTAGKEASTPVVYVSQNGSFVRVGISSGKISTYSASQTLIATVKASSCNVYRTTSTSDGARGFLYRGMRAPASAVINGMVQLPGIGYVQTGSVTLTQAAEAKTSRLTSFRETAAGNELSFTLLFDTVPVVYPSYSDDGLIIEVTPLAQSLVPDSRYFAISSSKKESLVRYTLKLKDGAGIDGYRLEPVENGVRLTVKKHSAGSLSGRTIMIDPGHGGSDPGAIGVDAATPEKASNLATALALRDELQKRGATVLLTRSKDTGVSLTDRLNQSQTKAPDLFLSIHSNSIANDKDASKLRGTLLFVRSALSEGAANLVAEELRGIGRTCTVTTGSALYVCRGEHTISMLLENEFISNPYGFELIRSESERAALCAAIADGIEAFWKQ